MSTAKRTLVIGFGSTLRGDDALGRIACQRLREVVDQERVKVIDQTAPTPELAVEVAGASLVIFLDASVDGPVDQVVTHRLSAVDSNQAMAHSLDAQSIVALADRLYGHRPPAYLISSRGRSFDISDYRLTREVGAACEQIVQRTLDILTQENHVSRPDNPQMQVD